MASINLLAKTRPQTPWETSNVVWTTDDGAYSIVEIKTQWDYELEGFYLAHCLGTKDAAEFGKAHRCFSVRDKLGYPHATILLQEVGQFSPYGQSRDLLTDATMKLPSEQSRFLNKPYKVLQVRGREDAVARWEYYAIVRKWYQECGGQLPDYDESVVRKALIKHQDTDLKYHYGYVLNLNKNFFTWSYWHEELLREAWLLGRVKLDKGEEGNNEAPVSRRSLV